MQLKLKVYKDGDKMCVLCGENLQGGTAGFGKTLKEAFDDFCKQWIKHMEIAVAGKVEDHKIFKEQK